MGETMPVDAVYPAGNDGLAALNTLEMGRFTGRDGAQFALELEQQLRNVVIGGQPYYDIRLAGRGSASDARITGSADSSVETRSEIGRERVCAQRNNKGNCTKYRNVEVRCTRRNVTLSFTVSVTGRRNERLYSAAKPLVGSELICPRSNGVAPVDVVVAGLVAEAARELRFEFAPAQVALEVRVKEGTSGLQGKAKSTFKSAVKTVERNIADACDMWAEVDYLVPDHAPTLFNLGLCAESDGDYDEAEAHYTQSAGLDRSERYVIEAIERLNKRRRADQQLAMQASRR
jgi:hypothetical protein